MDNNYIIGQLTQATDLLNELKGYLTGNSFISNQLNFLPKSSGKKVINFKNDILGRNEGHIKIKEEEINMPGITLRNDGRWMGRFCQDGKRYSIYAKTKKECMAKLKEAIEMKSSGSMPSNEVNKNSSFDVMWNHWYNTYKLPRLKESSAIVLKRYYVYHLKKKLGSKKINLIKGDDLQSILNNITSQSSKKKCYEQLADFFRVIYKNQYISHNPMDAVDLNYIRPVSKKRSITYAEEMILDNGLKGYWMHPLVFLILYTGMRKGEALALTWEDVDFDKNTITINKSFDRYSKKITDPKSKTSNRLIPLFPQAKRILLEINQNKDMSGELFANHSKSNVGELFKKKARQLKLADEITLHALRHTFATRLMEAGVADKVRQAWLGHSSVEITNSIYTHVNRYFEALEASKANEYFENKLVDTTFDTTFLPK